MAQATGEPDPVGHPLILSLATRTPAEAISQTEAAAHAVPRCAVHPRQKRIIQEVYKRTGIESRYFVLAKESQTPGEPFFRPRRNQSDREPTTAERMRRYREEAGRLAAACSREALQAAGVSPEVITHLVTVSCTGFASPGFDLDLVQQSIVPPDVKRTHIGFMGCHAAINGLRAADAFVRADPRHKVLLCCVELCSLHFQYGWDSDSVIANSLFADGAAGAVIAQASPGSTSPAARLAAFHSIVLPDTADLMTWTVQDHGFRMTLSSGVPDAISAVLPGILDEWLWQSGLERRDIRGWAVHPGGPRILTSIQSCLDLSDEFMMPSRRILSSAGNISSPTVLFILQTLQAAQRPYLPCVVMAFGPGLTLELLLLS